MTDRSVVISEPNRTWDVKALPERAQSLELEEEGAAPPHVGDVRREARHVGGRAARRGGVEALLERVEALPDGLQERSGATSLLARIVLRQALEQAVWSGVWSGEGQISSSGVLRPSCSVSFV